jgi:4-hydroxymandelate oxidase
MTEPDPAAPLNLAEFEPLARARLRADVYDYYAGGADDEITVRANTEAFRALELRYRVLVDVAERDLSTRVFDVPLAWPVILAPTALHRMAHPDGERATARAAAATGTLLTLSSISSVSLEEVADSAPGAPRWFQLYHFNDRDKSLTMIERAHRAGYGAIVLTVDAPLIGRRERDLRNPFAMPEGIEAVHFGVDPRLATADSPLAAFISQPSINWSDLGWIRTASPLPLLLKGIVRADDAKRALDEGVDGLWVSNHGGRQLDTSVPTARALPEIVEAVAGRVPLVVDGGIRRGTDALKALALGADLVAIGRPQLWGLAVGGEDGLRRVLELLREEVSLAMALAGCASLADIDRSLILG